MKTLPFVRMCPHAKLLHDSFDVLTCYFFSSIRFLLMETITQALVG